MLTDVTNRQTDNARRHRQCLRTQHRSACVTETYVCKYSVKVRSEVADTVGRHDLVADDNGFVFL